MKTLQLLVLSVWSFVVLGCGSPQDTVDALQKEIAAYPTDHSDAAASRIDEQFSRLAGQIKKLQESGKSAEADSFARQRDALQAQYAAARMTASLLKAKQAAEGLGEAFRQAGESIGEAFRGTAEPSTDE